MNISLVEIDPMTRASVLSGSYHYLFQHAANDGATHVLEMQVFEVSAGECSEVFRLAFMPVESVGQVEKADAWYRSTQLASDWRAAAVAVHPIANFTTPEQEPVVQERPSFVQRILSGLGLGR